MEGNEREALAAYMAACEQATAGVAQHLEAVAELRAALYRPGGFGDGFRGAAALGEEHLSQAHGYLCDLTTEMQGRLRQLADHDPDGWSDGNQ